MPRGRIPELFPALALCGAALLAGPSRAADAALIEAAKKEGEVVWYTTQILDPLVLRLQEAFREKHGIEIRPVRANSSEIALRVLNEGRAGKTQADIYDGTTTAEALKKEKLAMKWLPDNARELPPDYVDPDGYWAEVGNRLDWIEPFTEVKDISFNAKIIKS